MKRKRKKCIDYFTFLLCGIQLRHKIAQLFYEINVYYIQHYNVDIKYTWDQIERIIQNIYYIIQVPKYKYEKGTKMQLKSISSQGYIVARRIYQWKMARVK